MACLPATCPADVSVAQAHECCCCIRAGQLVPCTQSLCPYATWTPQGVAINRAVYNSYTCGLASVNANSPSQLRAAGYQVTSALASYTLSQMVGSCMLPRRAWTASRCTERLCT